MRTRCDSPPDSVDVDRSRERYPSPMRTRSLRPRGQGVEHPLQRRRLDAAARTRSSSSTCMAAQSAMETPSMRQLRAGSLSRVPPQAGHGPDVVMRSIAVRMCGWRSAELLGQVGPLEAGDQPPVGEVHLPVLELDLVAVEQPLPLLVGVVAQLLGGVEEAGVGEDRPRPRVDGVTRESGSGPRRGCGRGRAARRRRCCDARPSPSHSGHMPAGSLKPRAEAGCTAGSPSRENRIRSSEELSVAVPTVDRALLPIRAWSTTIAADRLSTESTSGRP